MDDELLHIRVGKKIKKEMQSLIDQGLFTNQSEMAREGLRDLLLKYEKYSKDTDHSKNTDKSQNDSQVQKQQIKSKSLTKDGGAR